MAKKPVTDETTNDETEGEEVAAPKPSKEKAAPAAPPEEHHLQDGKGGEFESIGGGQVRRIEPKAQA